jgi:hypothetical protein
LNEHRRRRLRDQARFFNDFYKMAYYSDSDGTICWYLPGGIRGVHPQAQSDFGVLNPDRSLRPVSRVIQRWGPVLMNPQRPPKPVVSIPIEPEAHVDGIHGVYEQVKDAFYSAIDADKSPRLVAPR